MLELNKWFFVLLLNFLVLIYVLNLILFKPLLRLFKERDDSIKGSLDAARDMDKKKEDAVAAMNHELKEARSKANELFESVRKEGLQRQKELLETAHTQAQDFILTAKGELQSEAGNARQKLRADVEKFSEEIVKKLVGV